MPVGRPTRLGAPPKRDQTQARMGSVFAASVDGGRLWLQARPTQSGTMLGPRGRPPRPPPQGWVEWLDKHPSAGDQVPATLRGDLLVTHSVLAVSPPCHLLCSLHMSRGIPSQRSRAHVNLCSGAGFWGDPEQARGSRRVSACISTTGASAILEPRD